MTLARRSPWSAKLLILLALAVACIASLETATPVRNMFRVAQEVMNGPDAAAKDRAFRSGDRAVSKPVAHIYGEHGHTSRASIILAAGILLAAEDIPLAEGRV